MRPADWQRLSLLLDELSDLPATDREARLMTLPPDLAAPLRRMLADLPEGGPAAASSIFGFQQQLAGALSGPAADAPKPGDRFGAWCLAELLGEGGMGQVWRAERADGLYQGEAAIKLLRNDVAGVGLAARFARGRVLLGRLAPAGIARLPERNLAFVVWRMAAEDVDAATARSEDLIHRWDAIAGPGIDADAPAVGRLLPAARAVRARAPATGAGPDADRSRRRRGRADRPAAPHRAAGGARAGRRHGQGRPWAADID